MTRAFDDDLDAFALSSEHRLCAQVELDSSPGGDCFLHRVPDEDVREREVSRPPFRDHTRIERGAQRLDHLGGKAAEELRNAPRGKLPTEHGGGIKDCSRLSRKGRDPLDDELAHGRRQ